MPPKIDLFHTEPDAEEPDLTADECHCKPADDQYLLTIEEGTAVIVHAACGKQHPSSWGDWHDLTVMDNPIPVTVEWVAECNRSAWHGMTPCDCGAIVQVTATSVPEDVRAAALELSRKHASDRAAAAITPTPVRVEADVRHEQLHGHPERHVLQESHRVQGLRAAFAACGTPGRPAGGRPQSPELRGGAAGPWLPHPVSGEPRRRTDERVRSRWRGVFGLFG
ncbi:hypothetical protein [Streptomyces cavernae]|uniref:hypothetical protein n=1 Tax=Streptomyces cavernae TaxID=2259034 RepID=UPI000FEBD57B|nr:hypothetical protein [Streptomyces cavernae]